MSLARLSAGAGYQYLLRHTACGDVERNASTPLTAYYTSAGYPPGRWTGSGLDGLGNGVGLRAGSPVIEEQMAALYGKGRDPIHGDPLGRAYPTFSTAEQRVATRTEALPAELDTEARKAAIARIEEVEHSRPSRGAVAGFDLTFTVPKSASVLWALSDPGTQNAVLRAHRLAVDEALAFVEQRALFTRIGSRSCAQVPTRGLIAAVFDHWDTRTSDPNLHSHVVIANKVQGLDGRWRSVDSRALHHAVVAVSEVYDNLFADQLARELPVSWSWRDRGTRRTPAFELDGIDDDLLAEFSTRAAHIDLALRTKIADFHSTHGRGPNRVEILRLRQQATRATRPAKTAHPLSHLLTSWRERALHHLGRTPDHITARALNRDQGRTGPVRARDISDAGVARMADEALAQVMTRRSTWTRWNLTAEAARATRGIRLATPADRVELHDRVVRTALSECVALQPPDIFSVPKHFRRVDGSSVFRRPDEEPFTHIRVLDAEQRLLDAHTDETAPVASEVAARRIAATPQRSTRGSVVTLAPDQVDAVVSIATSGRRIDVLVGPAGTGKTTTLRAVRAAWETTHGRGSVLGLAPSATAAKELADSLQIPCENVSKWMHETTGPGGVRRGELVEDLQEQRARAVERSDPRTARCIDRALSELTHQDARWKLRAGQLLIVDEASMAGTFDLDGLAQQASTASAKLLLVGDHRQLSAIDAGGVFGLLADAGHSSELRSLWRFRNRWEAGATRLLRTGAPAALDLYASNGRLHAGESDVMLEAAYRGWWASEKSGQSAILVAADTVSVQALNTRAHEDRVLDSSVAPDGVQIADGAVAAVGDRVLTRKNDRTIRTHEGGHVRNGALWIVTSTQPDGSLMVAPMARDQLEGTELEPSQAVTLPREYVSEHVELGYAMTVHRAQGLTVDHAHVVASPGMTREALYVGMTRGRVGNHLYVSTDAIDVDCDELPDAGRTQDGSQVLQAILASRSAEASATETMRTRQHEADSLASLLPIKATLIADSDVGRWRRLLPACALTAGQTETVLASPAAGPLMAALRSGEQSGYRMDRVLARLIAIRPLDSPSDPVEDLAAVLHARVTAWLETREGAVSPPTDGQQPEAAPLLGLGGLLLDPSDPAASTLIELDALIRARIASLTTDALDSRPSWTRPVGDEPIGDGRRPWRQQLAILAAYRDTYGIVDSTPLGRDPSRDENDRRQRRHAAAAAAVSAMDRISSEWRSLSR